MKDWEKTILTQVRLEMEQDDPFSERVEYVEFLSRSNGRGRRRRRWPRDVALLIVDGTAFQVKGGEVKSRKKRIPLDSLADEILTDLPRDERTIDALLLRAKTRAKIK